MFGRKGEFSTRVVPTLLAGALFVCACGSLASLWAQGTGECTIRGKVRGPDSRPVKVKVQLQNEAGYVVDFVYTDGEGGFTFLAVRDGSYHVFVDDERFRRTEVSARVAVTLYPSESVLLSLEPRNQTSTSPPDYLGNSHAVSVRELKQKYPKGALKQYEKGNKKMERADLKGAIDCFEKALAIAPGMAPALNNLGTAYLEDHRLPEAEATLRKALMADPDAPDVYVNLGHVYFELKKYDEAENFLARGLEHNPNAALAYYFLGLTDLRIGKARQGEANLKRALDLNDPQVVTAHLILANLYLKAHRPSQARKHLESFLKLRPQDPQADHIRDVLARLKAESTQ